MKLIEQVTSRFVLMTDGKNWKSGGGAPTKNS